MKLKDILRMPIGSVIDLIPGSPDSGRIITVTGNGVANPNKASQMEVATEPTSVFGWWTDDNFPNNLNGPDHGSDPQHEDSDCLQNEFHPQKAQNSTRRSHESSCPIPRALPA